MGEQAIPGGSLYMLHRSKTLHLVRHAQGVHNVAYQKSPDNLLSNEFFDAELTPLGWKQVDNLRKYVEETGLSRRIDLVVTSCMLRTMQTAVGVFGGKANIHKNHVVNGAPNLMVQNAGKSGRPAITSLNCPPFVAVELCREILGVHPCDKRRSLREYKSLFPGIDFSQVQSDEDTLWKPDVKETKKEVAARGLKFLKWLWTRKEKEIAIVTHSAFMSQAMGVFTSDCPLFVKSELCRKYANCELRSIVIADKRWENI